MLRIVAAVAVLACVSAPTFGESYKVHARDLGLVPVYDRAFAPWDPASGVTEEEYNEFVELNGGWDSAFSPYDMSMVTDDMLRTVGWDEYDNYDMDHWTGEITIYKDVYTDEDLALRRRSASVMAWTVDYGDAGITPITFSKPTERSLISSGM